jgi:hypothetical protein
MTYRVHAISILTLCALATPLRAQTLALRIGPGVAYADDVGWSRLVALELHHQALVVRADAHGVYVPGGNASIAYAGGAAGIAFPRAAVRPCLLATVAWGVDAREGDATSAVGVVAGLDLRPHLFAEVRYENSLQRSDPFYYTLPEHQVTATVGIRLGPTWQPPDQPVTRSPPGGDVWIRSPYEA